MLRLLPKQYKSLLVGLYYLVLAVFITWPVVLHLGEAVVGSVGDNIYFVWLIRWYQRAIFELHISPLFNPWMNYPEGWNLSTTDTAFSTTLPGVAFSLLFGPTAGYNLAALLTFVLAGLSMYWWVKRLTGLRSAGLIAGTAYACLPYWGAHFLVGHLNLMGIQWFPLYFMGLYDTLANRDSKLPWKSILLTAVALGLIAFSSMYYLYFGLLITLVFVGGFFLVGGWRRLSEKTYWLRLGVQTACAVPMLLAALAPFLSLANQGELADRSWEYARMYSASPLDFFHPATSHFLLGNWVSQHFYHDLWIESSLYIGVVALVLAVIAIVRRRSFNGLNGLVLAGLLSAAAAFILALGTDLHWQGAPVTIQIPALLQGILHRDTISPVYLPAYWLFNHLPYYAKMRALMRIGVFVLVFSSMLAGLGAAWLLKRVQTPWRRTLMAAAIIALVILDFYHGPYTISPIKPRQVDIWLAEQPGQGVVAQFPPDQLEDQQVIYGFMVSQKPFIGGFFNANKPLQYQRIQPVLETFPSNESRDLLQSLGVEYIVVDSTAYSDYPATDEAIRGFGFQVLNVLGTDWVYTFAKP